MALITRAESASGGGGLLMKKYIDSDLCEVSVKTDNDNKPQPANQETEGGWGGGVRSEDPQKKLFLEAGMMEPRLWLGADRVK